MKVKKTNLRSPNISKWILIGTMCCFTMMTYAQINSGVQFKKTNHNKQVIGYFTNWDAWKDVSGIVPKSGYNQLNIDYSQYTILNWSFLGVAKDGSLHSGDLRNKQIYQSGAVQEPGPMFWDDVYSTAFHVNLL